MAEMTAFGRPVSASMASAVLGSPSLNAAPSPSQPEHMPADGQAKKYAQLYAIAAAAMIEEQDLQKRVELERIVSFADKALAESAQATGSGGAPVPNIPAPPPAPPAPPQGMPPAAGPPQAPVAAGPPQPGAAG